LYAQTGVIPEPWVKGDEGGMLWMLGSGRTSHFWNMKKSQTLYENIMIPQTFTGNSLQKMDQTISIWMD